MDHTLVLGGLEKLVAETYTLWDQDWVGFTWRSYTLEHVNRVRGLSRTLGEAEHADTLVLAYASLLHDVTKGYDGEILMKDGQRHLDENGRWRNELVLPARRNHVTDLYDQMGLLGSLHNESGATLADALMAEHGLPAEFRASVAEVIRAHLRPGKEASAEERVLYDADTIDANIGLPAFHRNLYINLHREEAARPDFEQWVGPRREEFFRWYLGERVPAWISARRPEFLGRLTTAAGRALAERRYDRLARYVEGMAAEIPLWGEADTLGILDFLVDNRVNPRMSEQIGLLRARCNGSTSLACDLVAAMEREMVGAW